MSIGITDEDDGPGARELAYLGRDVVPVVLATMQPMSRVRRPRSDKDAFPRLRDDLHNEAGSCCSNDLDILAEIAGSPSYSGSVLETQRTPS